MPLYLRQGSFYILSTIRYSHPSIHPSSFFLTLFFFSCSHVLHGYRNCFTHPFLFMSNSCISFFIVTFVNSLHCIIYLFLLYYFNATGTFGRAAPRIGTASCSWFEYLSRLVITVYRCCARRYSVPTPHSTQPHVPLLILSLYHHLNIT